MFRLVQCFKSFALSHTKISLHLHLPFHFYSFIYTCLEPFTPIHLKYTQTKNDVIYLQSFNDTYITPTLQYHLILTRMSRLWPRKGTCIFYSVTVAYNFDVIVRYCGFCEGHDSLWVFRCLRFYFGKVINLFVLELRNWLFMKLASFFFHFSFLSYKS